MPTHYDLGVWMQAHFIEVWLIILVCVIPFAGVTLATTVIRRVRRFRTKPENHTSQEHIEDVELLRYDEIPPWETYSALDLPQTFTSPNT